jgi:endoglucanase
MNFGPNRQAFRYLSVKKIPMIPSPNSIMARIENNRDLLSDFIVTSLKLKSSLFPSFNPNSDYGQDKCRCVFKDNSKYSLEPCLITILLFKISELRTHLWSDYHAQRIILMNFSRFCAVAVSSVILLSLKHSYSEGYNYAEVLQKSMWFYEVQRSGPLNPQTNRVEWRGSSAVNDGSDAGVDLSGGWYDAGDNMKFNFPMSSSVTLLAWGGLENANGYKKCGQWGYLLSNIKWVTDYLVKCHSAPHVFYGQIGIGMTDHKWWGSPEVFPNVRPAFKIDEAHPGSDLAAEAAAALASSSILFRAADAAYADKLLQHAKELYDFADKYRGLYSDAITDVADFYKSWSGYIDELVWGASWLYIATGDSKYLTKAESLFDSLGFENQTTIPKYKEALSWDDKTYGCYVLLAKITNKSKYHTCAQRWLDWWSYGFAARQAGKTSWTGDSGIAYTPSGLAWIRNWGPYPLCCQYGFGGSFVYQMY